MANLIFIKLIIKVNNHPCNDFDNANKITEIIVGLRNNVPIDPDSYPLNPFIGE